MARVEQGSYWAQIHSCYIRHGGRNRNNPSYHYDNVGWTKPADGDVTIIDVALPTPS
jgi:hypothetical protein